MRRDPIKELSLAGVFEDSVARLPGADVAWLGALRHRGIGAFRTHGLPTRRVEAWKHTNLNALAKLAFAPVNENPTLTAAGMDPIPADAPLAVDGACRIVFVNGRLNTELSDLDQLPDGVEAAGLADLLTRDPASLEGRLAAVNEDRDGAMAALNAAFMEDGLVLRIAEGATVETPIHLISVGAPAGEQPIAFHPRNLVVAGKDSTAVLVESYIGDGVYLSNGVSDIAVGEGATLTHAKLQDEGDAAFHLAFNRVRLADKAVYDGFVLQRGGLLARHETRVAIEGGDAECRLNGAYLGAGRQLHDNTTIVEHRAPGSVSSEVFKGVLDGHARGVFQARTVVARDAQQSDGRQLNKTLLLSRDAEMDTKPELEIYADDVKCSHGATVGALSDAELFYLRSRGIDEATARDMLVSAFLSEAVDELRHGGLADAFRGRIAGWVEARHAAQAEAAA